MLLEYLHTLSGQTAPVHGHPHKKVLPYVQVEVLHISFSPLPLVLLSMADYYVLIAVIFKQAGTIISFAL